MHIRLADAAPWLTLALLLFVQAALVFGFVMGDAGVFGDEFYYLSRAATFRHHGLPVANARTLAAERDPSWRDVTHLDFRPPGYPAFLAALSGGDLRPRILRRNVAAVQAMLIAAALLSAMAAVQQVVVGWRARTAVALLLGSAPWPFEHAASILADSLAASLSTLGTLLIWAATQRRREAPVTAAVGMLGLSICLLLRPDMAVMPPVIALAAVILRGHATFRRTLLAMAAAFFFVVALQYGYRVHFTQSIRTPLYPYKALRFYKGLGDWGARLRLPEKTALPFIWSLSAGEVPEPLPATAYRSAEERAAVDAIIQTVGRERRYTPAIDDAFERLNRQHAAESFISYHLVPRIWHPYQLWINKETNSQLLHFLSDQPRWASRAIVAAAFLARIIVVLLAITGFARATFMWFKGVRTPAIALMLLSATFVLGRTAVIGVIANSMEHRYVLPAWILMLIGACAAPFLGRSLAPRS